MQIQGQEYQNHEIQAQPAAVAQYQDCIPEEDTVVVFNDHVQTLKTLNVKSLNNPRPELQIRPLWLSKPISSELHYIGCKINTGAS